MKKTILLSLATAAFCLPAFAATASFPIDTKPLENPSKVVDIGHLTDGDLSEIMQGHNPEVAVAFPAHTVLPIHFFLKGDFVHLVEGDGKFGQVEVTQTFYARYVQGALLLSSNLMEWKPFLEFLTGDLSIALNIQDGQPSIVFGAETHRRS